MRPSDGMELDELREEFDWMCKFQSRMAERIRGDADVHNLVDYVRKLEAENAKLRELVRDMMQFFENGGYCDTCEKAAECEESEIYESDCLMRRVFKDRIHELGIEVDA